MTRGTVTTWRSKLTDALHERGESWDDVVASTLSEADLDRPFDAGYGAPEGVPFTCWTRESVYFPACYDGMEWVASVARHPDGQPTSHIGG